MTVTLKEVGEKNLLLKLRRFLGDSPDIVRVFSEDCAVMRGPSGQYRLFTTDSLVENVHFNRDYSDAYSIGRKAVLVNLSDISAMGGTPEFFMLSAGFPDETAIEFVEDLYQGMLSAALESDIVFTGGNITQSPHLIIDIFMSGNVPAEEALFRNGGKAGDSIFVNASLGASAAGLMCLKKGYRVSKAESMIMERVIKMHLQPPNHSRFARKIASTRLVSSMIDLSDGLAGDLAELCRESATGALIDVTKIPIDDGVKELSKSMGWDPLELALYGGEDYHLLFTVPALHKSRFLEQMKSESVVVYEIGVMTEFSGKILGTKNGEKFPLKSGYEHF